MKQQKSKLLFPGTFLRAIFIEQKVKALSPLPGAQLVPAEVLRILRTTVFPGIE
jgi:hypothetical protein